MMFATNDTTSGNFRISTSKWRSSFLYALAVTILHLSRTAGKLRKYPAGSSCGSGGRGMAMLGIGLGEKGVTGVVDPPVVLAVPADVRFMTREPVLMGEMTLEDPDVSDDFDCEAGSVGCGFLGALGTLPLFENKPMSVVVCSRFFRARCDRPVAGGAATGSLELGS